MFLREKENKFMEIILSSPKLSGEKLLNSPDSSVSVLFSKEILVFGTLFSQH